LSLASDHDHGLGEEEGEEEEERGGSDGWGESDDDDNDNNDVMMMMTDDILPLTFCCHCCFSPVFLLSLVDEVFTARVFVDDYD
jgi:hypothetical protein